MRISDIILIIDAILILVLVLILIIHGGIVEVLFAINRKEIKAKFFNKFSFGTFSKPNERIKFLYHLVKENQGLRARIFFLRMLKWYKYEKIYSILMSILFFIMLLLSIWMLFSR